MARTHARPRNRIPGDDQKLSHQPPAERFPPLSTSLENFIQDGSDRKFRRLIYSLTALSSLMVQNREHFAAYIGVSDAQYMMITMIAEHPGVTVGKVAELLGVSSQFVTIEITKLIKKGIVTKKPNEADRRSMLLELTPKGRNLLHELGPLRRRTNDMTFRSLNEPRATTLQEIVGALVEDARGALHELEAPQMRGLRAPSAQAIKD
jgi:MarR family transcriptional regulator, organic hydroperoxide resistance regulator